MKIGFDIRPLCLSKKVTGIGVYTKNLIESLSRLDQDNEYLLLTLKGRDYPDISLADGFRHKFVPLPMAFPEYFNLVRDRFTLSGIVDRFSPDVVHFPSPFEMKIHFNLGRHNNKALLTMHDLTPLIYADRIFIGKRKLLQPIYMGLLRDVSLAGKIIAVSHSSGDDLVKYLNIPREKIAIVYQGKDESFRVVDDRAVLEEARIRYNLPDRFLLYVGGFGYHKNLFALLEAHALLKVEYLIEIPLVIAGTIDGFFFSELKELVSRLDLEGRVIFPGFIPHNDLPLIYNMAALFVFPSLYEGFGLPIIESMACGTPVACSNTSSLPEIAGDTALLFNPENIFEMAEVIHLGLVDESGREKMRRMGIERARDFSWERTASETLELYRSMVDRGV